MPDIDLKEKRKFAIEKVAGYFSGFDTPFVPVHKNCLPENGSPPKDPNIASWNGTIDCEGQWIEVILALRSTFPDNLPRIYLVKPPYLIPHVTEGRENHVCSINRSQVYLNPSEPVLIVLDTLQFAAEVITEGLQGRNADEFDREFQAYWLQETRVNWLSIISPGGNSRIVWVLHFKPTLGKYSSLIAERKEMGEAWLKRIDRNINGEIERALYLPLTQPVRPPFPKTNFELNKTLKSGNKAALADLYAYLEESQSRMSYVIFSFEVNAYHTLGGWIHTRPPSGKKPLRQGYRDHKIPIPGKIQLTSCFGGMELIKSGVDRVDGDRLQARVGNKKSALIGEKCVLIAGCGSIGSKIALNLALSGINRFILIDNDIFSIENVARHICNMSMVGAKKVDSVAEVIQAHMPHVKIQKEANDFYDMIADHSDILEQCDLIISAIGDRNLNLRLNGIHIAKCQDTAALYVWTEVFGYASHSILVAPHAGGCLNCIMDDDYQFRHRVVMLSASETSKQEAGCGSSFLPYGVMDADIAAGTASRLGLSYLMGEIRRSVRWVYLGDLEKASEQKIPISSHYQSSGCNRLIKHSLTSNSACSVCCVRVRHAL